MRRRIIALMAAAAASLSALWLWPGTARAACCYFAAKDKDVTQPAQKAFVTWDPAEKVESFTVQPKFEGNAQDFGMVVPTPGRPKLDEMPRDFFKELAVFTLLKKREYPQSKLLIYPEEKAAASGAVADRRFDVLRKTLDSVKVLESGVVGSLDYKVIQATQADDLYAWLKENQYQYAGDQETLDFYIKNGWYFTVMKIDAKQMKPRPDGTYDGEVTPTRFQFSSDKLGYPLPMTRISVKDKTEAIFYIQAAHKMDLPGDLSYQPSFVPMWSQATSFALPDKLTEQEKSWQGHVKDRVSKMVEQVNADRQKRHEPARLEWAKKLTEGDIGVLTGEKKYNRDAPAEDVAKLKVLKGHLKDGRFVT